MHVHLAGFVLWLVQSLLTAITKATSRILQSSISDCLHIMFNVSIHVD